MVRAKHAAARAQSADTQTDGASLCFPRTGAPGVTYGMARHDVPNRRGPSAAHDGIQSLRQAQPEEFQCRKRGGVRLRPPATEHGASGAGGGREGRSRRIQHPDYQLRPQPGTHALLAIRRGLPLPLQRGRGPRLPVQPRLSPHRAHQGGAAAGTDGRGRAHIPDGQRHKEQLVGHGARPTPPRAAVP